MSDVRSFRPDISRAAGIAIAATSARVQLPQGFTQFRLHNDASETLFLKIGGASVAATASYTGNLSLEPGATELMTLKKASEDAVYLAAIGTGANGTLGIVPGDLV